MRTEVVLSAALLMSGCAYDYKPPEPTPVAAIVAPPFNATDASWASQAGSNRITGAAATRTRGGDPKTCAGLEVVLVPQTAYTRAVFHQAFFEPKEVSEEAISSVQINDWRKFSAPLLEGADPRQHDLDRRTRCDGAGNFEFDDLPDGDWFVTTAVIWSTPRPYAPGRTDEEGEMMLARVHTSGGHTTRVVLSPL